MTLVTEVIRVSMNVAEFFICVGAAFALGFAGGWWVK